jgi:hypothetical protein
MQFALGAHSTLLYNKPMASLKEKYPDSFPNQFDSAKTIHDFSFFLEDLHIHASQLKTIDYGDSIDWSDTTHLKIIGTLGAE